MRTARSHRRRVPPACRSRAGRPPTPTRPGTTALLRLAAIAAPLLLLLPVPLSAQSGDDLEFGGLLRTGFRAGPEGQDRDDGFEIFDARLSAGGSLGIVFEYFVQAEFDPEDDDDEFRLLDARLGIPIQPEITLEIGQFRAPFGREALQEKAEISFVERSQITQVVAPGRQVGAQLRGELMEGRLAYRGGLFNGTGREVDNDGDGFLWAARVRYATEDPDRRFPSRGPTLRVGANVAFSSDSAGVIGELAESDPEGLTPDDPRIDPRSFQGDRLLFGGDLEATYRRFSLRAEFLRGEFEPDAVLALPRPGAPPRVFEEEVVAQGGYLEAGYSAFGLIEGLARWDAMNDFLRQVEEVPVRADDTGDAHFLVLGVNLTLDRHTKLGLQYSVGLDGTRRGPGLADDEFTINFQASF